MDHLHQLEIIILLMAVVLALTTVSQKIGIPYPIFLVLGGLVLGMAPHVPHVVLHPDLVFLVFLPPILWAAAYFTSLREFRRNIRPISLLAVGLVLATSVGVAVVAHSLLPGMGWAAAIALGAIVSPPDAVSATAVGKRLRIPRRVVAILEGESLVNDATALVLYRAAVAAAVSGTFVWSETLLEFVYAAAVGVAIGLAVSAFTNWMLRVTEDGYTQIGITLLAPYIAWVVGELVHASAVLACVAGGLHLRRYFGGAVVPATRLQARAVWDLLIYLLNGVIFILIGLQLGVLRETAPLGQLGPVVVAGAWISLAAVVVRLIWVPLSALVPRWLSPALRRRDPLPPWPHIFVVSWTGMRGIVTLAGALALPLTTSDGAPFPFRTEIILISFAVIFSTLVVQGLTLPPLIRLLRFTDDHEEQHEIMLAQTHATTAALSRLDQLLEEDWVTAELVERVRLRYSRRLERFARAGVTPKTTPLDDVETLRRLEHDVLSTERAAVVELRNQGKISDDVLLQLEQELDVAALHAGVGHRRTPRRPRVPA